MPSKKPLEHIFIIAETCVRLWHPLREPGEATSREKTTSDEKGNYFNGSVERLVNSDVNVCLYSK